MYAGRKTAETMLGTWEQVAQAEDEEDLEEEPFRSLTDKERATLQAFIDTLEANQERDPKWALTGPGSPHPEGTLHYLRGGVPVWRS